MIYEVLETSLYCAKDRKSKTINPTDIMNGLRSDHELSYFFKDKIIAEFTKDGDLKNLSVVSRNIDEV